MDKYKPSDDKSKVVSIASSASFGINTSAASQLRMVEDLAKSGLLPSDVPGILPYNASKHSIPFPIATLKGSKEKVSVGSYVEAAYIFPMLYPDGRPIPDVSVTRLFYNERAPKEVKDIKYAHPSKRVVGPFANVPYMVLGRRKNLGDDKTMDSHEGMKKATCGYKHGQCSIAHMGANSWGDPDRKGELHPWILKEIQEAGIKRVRIWPDADFRTNMQVERGYRGYADALRKAGVEEIVLCDLSEIRPGAKFDDLVAEIGYEEVMARVKYVDPFSLRESPDSLVRNYRLAHFPLSEKQPTLLPQPLHFNIITLLERHPYFRDKEDRSRIWYDIDTGTVMYNDEPVQDVILSNEVLCTFQDRFGFNGRSTVSKTLIDNALGAHLALNRRSPFIERCRAAEAAAQARGENLTTDEKDDSLLNTWAVKYLYAPDNEWSRRWARKFIMGIVGRALHPGCFHRTAFALLGKQTIGKTGLPRVFVGDAMVIIGKNSGEGKDMAMLYHSGLVMCQDEAGKISTTEMAHLKSEISSTSDKFRPPYGRAVEPHPRRCLFYIPTDKPDFLAHDSAGMHRWAVLDLLGTEHSSKRFDFDGLKAPGVVDTILAQALVAVEAGEEFAEVEGAQESAEGHTAADVVVEKVLEGFAKGLIAYKRGVYNGVGFAGKGDVVAVKLNDVAGFLGTPVVGRATEAVAGPLRKIGFVPMGDNKDVLGMKRAWVVSASKLEEMAGELKPKGSVDKY